MRETDEHCVQAEPSQAIKKQTYEIASGSCRRPVGCRGVEATSRVEQDKAATQHEIDRGVDVAGGGSSKIIDVHMNPLMRKCDLVARVSWVELRSKQLSWQVRVLPARTFERRLPGTFSSV